MVPEWWPMLVQFVFDTARCVHRDRRLGSSRRARCPTSRKISPASSARRCSTPTESFPLNDFCMNQLLQSSKKGNYLRWKRLPRVTCNAASSAYRAADYMAIEALANAPSVRKLPRERDLTSVLGKASKR